MSAHQSLASPQLYPIAIGENSVRFASMTRQTYGASTFLDSRLVTAPGEILAIDRGAVQSAAHAMPKPRAWLFHTTFCGSTLMSRLLERHGALVLREPGLLDTLCGSACNGLDDASKADWHAKLNLLLPLLGRQFEPEMPVIVKGSTACNFLFPELLEDGSLAIFLHFGLISHLVATMRTPAHREHFKATLKVLAPAVEAEVGSLAGVHEYEAAAALWLAQMRSFIRASATIPGLASLDTEAFFDTPGEALANVSAFFQLPGSSPAAPIEPKDPLLGRHAKLPEMRYSGDLRQALQEQRRPLIKDDLARAVRFVAARTAEKPLPAVLPRPLMTGRSLLSPASS